MAWTSVTRGSTHHMKLCKDELSDQLVLGLVSSCLSQSSQGTRKRHQQSVMNPKDEMADDDELGDDLTHPAEKKRRLTAEQVKFLEMSFNMDLKLEPERKALIAKRLGLRPRQVAIWFQNRRARWKNKQLEQDYEALKAKYEAAVKENGAILKQNEAMLEENKRLKAEVTQLKALIDNGARVKLSPDSDSDVESGGSKEQKSELASPAKSEDQSDLQDQSDLPMPEIITCTAVKFESEEHRALSPSEEVLGLLSHPLLFQQIVTGYQVHQMEDLFSSWEEDHAYEWGGQWDS